MYYKNVTPLSTTFMLISIIGGMVSATYVYGVSPPFGFAFFLVFFFMFLASVVSMTIAPVHANFHVQRERDLKRLGRIRK